MNVISLFPPRPRRVLGTLALLAATLLLASGVAQALPDSIKKQLHKYEEYRILVVEGGKPAETAKKLFARPQDYKIVVWQSLLENTREEDIKKVLEWVDQGGVLWFQDSRLAHLFGMQADPVAKSDLRKFKPHKGTYGGMKKTRGVATLAMAPPTRPHGVLAGIDAVQVFLLEVAPDSFSAVRQTPELIPLLKLEVLSSEPLSTKCVSCMQPRGKGFVVLKPLIWTEQLNGDRFQYNLLEWSAGFPVPDAGAMSGVPMPSAQRTTAPVPQFDEVVTQDQGVVKGTILTSEFSFTSYESGLATLKVPFAEVSDIVMREDGARDAVTGRDGKKRFGTVQLADTLQIRDTNGVVQKLKKMNIIRITVHPQEKGK